MTAINPDPGTGGDDTRVVIVGPDGTYDTTGPRACMYHRHGCSYLTASTTAGKQPWPRDEVTLAVIRAHPHWKPCPRCAP
jgi:hypothetical protein